MIFAVIPNNFFRKKSEKFFRGLQYQFYNKYITQYLHLENNITDSKGTWFFNNVIQKWWDNWSSLLSSMSYQGIQVVMRIFSAIVVIALSLWRVGFWIVVLFFGVSFAVSQYGNKKMANLRKNIRDYFTQVDRDIIRLIMSKFEVVQNKKSVYELNKLSGWFDNITERKYQESDMKILTFDIQKWWVYLLQICLALYVWYGVYHGQYELWFLSLVWILSNQINAWVQELNEYITDFYSKIIYVEKLRETFDDVPMIQWYETGKEFIYKRGDIVLDTITYDYGKGEVLKDFSLTIKWGRKTALVGISGSGKSTLIKLIAWYIHPQFGTIIVDKQQLPNGQNDDFVSLESYYQHIGYLTQEPNVFDGTIYENLTYALQTSSPSLLPATQDFSCQIDPLQGQKGDHKDSSLEKKIETVIKLAQCEFIYDFPDGLETHIWEKWIKLSGWQRQRLAIAKIMLKNPQIILLDEPTSALDSFSEEEVTKALENLFHWKTVIVIAHRLQTVKKADEIIVLEWWKVVEQWSHSQLVQLWWQYAKMLELQSGF
jgi:ABC-type multidrug transport system fused ATPase/permease subunit